MNMKKLFCLFLSLIFISLNLCGCGKLFDFSDSSSSSSKKEQPKQEESNEKKEFIPATAQINQNDYAGACLRINQIRTKVKEATSILNDYTNQIIEENPGDYWDNDSYFFLDFLPVHDDVFDVTAKLNEQDPEASLGAYYKTIFENAGYGDFNFFKRSENDYMFRYSGYFTNKTAWKKVQGKCEEVCIYNPNQGALRFQMIAYDGQSRLITTHFYEFVPLGDNNFIFQDIDERLWVNYSEGKVNWFSYSKLNNGYQYKIDSLIPTKLNEESYSEYYKDNLNPSKPQNEDDNVSDEVVSSSDSIFANKNSLNEEWVFEKNNFSKKIIYDGSNFEITTYNEFTDTYEDVFVEVDGTDNDNDEASSGSSDNNAEVIDESENNADSEQVTNDSDIVDQPINNESFNKEYNDYDTDNNNYEYNNDIFYDEECINY